MNGFIAALRSEIHVGLATKGSKLVVLMPAVLVLLQLLLSKLSELGSNASAGLANGPGGFANSAPNNAWGVFADGLGTGLILLGLLLVAYSAYSFSFDRDTGAIRHLLIRRVSRPALILAKYVYFHLLAFCGVLFVLLIAYAGTASLWEFGPVVEDGFELISEQEIRSEILLGLRLALLPLPAAIALGVLVSVLANSATAAVTGALGITLAMDIFKSALGDWSAYLYASYQPSILDESYLQDVSSLVRGYSDVLVDQRLLDFNTWIPLPTLLLFLGLALFFVRGRKL